MWKIIQETTNKVPSKNKNNLKLKIGNSIVDEPQQIANILNDFFASISNSKNKVINSDTKTKDNKIKNSFFLRPMAPQEIYTIIKSLKNKNSCGIDEIPPKLIKICVKELTFPFTKLINQSFIEGVFPEALKISVVKPIYKKGEKTDPNNYRPIALLPTSAKIFETAMSKQIYPFYEKYKILHENQNGFRKNMSTTLAVYKFTQYILDAINRKKYAVGLLLDMSKAYDKVSYEILLNKLYETGIRGPPHEWFKSYLKNRSQYTEIQNTNFITGEIRNIRSAVVNLSGSIPQGSVLGCLLFLIYINDLPTVMDDQEDDQCILFADDVSILLPCSNENELNAKLNTTLCKISNYIDCQNLELNLKKTSIIQFKPYQKKELQINYQYKNNIFKTVKSASLLGIEIDSDMSWKPHIQKLSNKLSSFTYALYNLKKVTDFKTALSAYYAYAHSRLSYGIILWGNCTDICDVFVLQKKCIRILTNIDQMESCRPLFKEHKIMTLTSIYIYESCKFVRKNNNLYSAVKTIKRNDRGLNTLIQPFSKLKLVTSGPHSMVIKIYNHIPNNIKNIDSITHFNNQLKQFLINKTYYSIQEFLEDKT